jgi:hypothetical protein
MKDGLSVVLDLSAAKPDEIRNALIDARGTIEQRCPDRRFEYMVLVPTHWKVPRDDPAFKPPVLTSNMTYARLYETIEASYEAAET